MSNNKVFSPDAQRKIREKLGEISKSKTRIEGERSYIKETIASLSEEFAVEKKILNKMATAFHKGNIKEQAADQDEFETLYEQVTGEAVRGDEDGDDQE